MVCRRWGAGVLALGLAACSDDGVAASGSGSSTSALTAGPDAGATSGDDSASASEGGSTAGSGPAGSGMGTSVPTGASEGTSGTTETGGRDAIWQPAPGTSWQWQLVGDIDTSVDVAVYDIDLFDAPQAIIDALHADGRSVICYFSAGSYEEWRDDADAFPAAAIGEPLDGWPGEAWLDHRDASIRAIMQARLDVALAKGCDAVEPDNVDGYINDTGFALTADEQLDYNRFLASEAHARGLSIGLKNDVDQVGALLDDFDWALNEECVAYQECQTLSPFIDQGKAVFHVEYVDDTAQGPGLAEQVCPQTTALGFSTLIKEWDLTIWRLPCE
ncbi:MAG: endo alpha-1,4 polygalactosaminidase [Nannocystaceae bacterium]|nr:endo alpha-1,4 polygalactosaminidase [bacterium]